MYLDLDGQKIELSIDTQNQLVELLFAKLISSYDRVDETIKFALKAYARKTLYDLEKKRGVEMRPPRGTDPILHFVQLIKNELQKGSLNVGTELKTTNMDGKRVITSLNFAIPRESESGG